MLLLLFAGVFLSLFQSTRDGLLWLLAGALGLGIMLLIFPVAT
ncbi:MAG: hypothetical protein R3B04_17540 [Nitrospira sp.]